MTPEQFVTAFVDHLHREAANLRTYGAEAQATTCEKNAADLADRLRAWWLQNLTTTEAASYSGYPEETLRQMAREGRLLHTRSAEGGPLAIRRCDLPTRSRPKPPEPNVHSLADRLLRPPEGGLRKPA